MQFFKMALQIRCKSNDDNSSDSKVQYTQQVDSKGLPVAKISGLCEDRSTACAYEPEPLSKEREIEIKAAYAKLYGSKVAQELTVDDIANFRYYGTYNDANAVMIRCKSETAPAMVVELVIAGCSFVFNDATYVIRLYSHGVFIDINAAHDNGYITKDDVQNIHRCYLTQINCKGESL